MKSERKTSLLSIFSRRSSASEVEILDGAFCDAIVNHNGVLPTEFIQQYGSKSREGFNTEPYRNHFMQDIAPALTNEQLYNLAKSLMENPIDNWALLRESDQLANNLYSELAIRLDYNPFQPETEIPTCMHVLHNLIQKNVSDEELIRKLQLDKNACAKHILLNLGPAFMERVSQGKEPLAAMELCRPYQSILANADDYPAIINAIQNEFVMNPDSVAPSSHELFGNSRDNEKTVLNGIVHLVNDLAMQYHAIEDAKTMSKKKYKDDVDLLKSRVNSVIEEDMTSKEKLDVIIDELARLFLEQASKWNTEDKKPSLMQRLSGTREDSSMGNRIEDIVLKFVGSLNESVDKNDSNYSRMLAVTLQCALIAKLKISGNVDDKQMGLLSELGTIKTPTSYTVAFQIAAKNALDVDLESGNVLRKNL